MRCSAGLPIKFASASSTFRGSSIFMRASKLPRRRWSFTSIEMRPRALVARPKTWPTSCRRCWQARRPGSYDASIAGIGIRVRYPDAVRFDPNAVQNLPLIYGDQGVVSVRAIATPVTDMVPSVLMHEGLQPVVIMTADRAGRDLGGLVRDVRRALAAVRVPSGYRLEIGGQFEAQQEAFKNLAMVTGFGLLLTLLVLIAQFRRIRPAIAVLATTPFALVGALVTLWATQTPLNASSLMGCVLLVGLEVKTGILLLEVAEQYAAEGHSYVNALALAGQRRIRPINVDHHGDNVRRVAARLGDRCWRGDSAPARRCGARRHCDFEVSEPRGAAVDGGSVRGDERAGTFADHSAMNSSLETGCSSPAGHGGPSLRSG